MSVPREQVNTRATVLGADGATWAEVPHDTARFLGTARHLLIEGQRTNVATNPRGEGIVGTAAPTGWTIAGSSLGIARSYVASTMSGLPSVVIGWSGTTTGAHIQRISIGGGWLPVTAGLSYAASAILRHAGGTFDSLTGLLFTVDWRDAGGVTIASSQAVAMLYGDISSAPKRYSGTITAPAGAVEALIGVRASTPTDATLSFSVEVGSAAARPSSW